MGLPFSLGTERSTVRVGSCPQLEGVLPVSRQCPRSQPQENTADCTVIYETGSLTHPTQDEATTEDS